MGLLALLISGCGSSSDPFPSHLPTHHTKTIRLDPAVLTLPSGAFHYDPLLTVRDENGQAMWVDLPTEVQAFSSNPLVATVNRRVRIRTTARPGTADINIHLVADPSVQATLKLTTVDATIQQVSVEGSTAFDLYVGQSIPLEATAWLSTGEVIPHAQFSSDLDFVTGTDYAAVVDGLGISALRPSPPNTPIAIGFFRGGGTATGTLSVRPMHLVDVQVFLGGNDGPNHEFLLPAGFSSVLEVLGTFEDGTSRQLQLNQDYSLTLSGDPGFRFSAPGYLSQSLPARTANLHIDLRDDIDGGIDIAARATTVDSSLVTGLSADFENDPGDPRLLPGLARELRVLADFPGLPHYRVSGLDPLWLNTPLGTKGLSSAAWPTLRANPSPASGSVQLTLGGASTTLHSVSVVTPQVLGVEALGKRPAAHIAIELGSHLAFRTLIDYGDGLLLDRTSDYPIAGPMPFLDLFSNATSFFLNTAGTLTFQARDAENQALPAPFVLVEVARQSDGD